MARLGLGVCVFLWCFTPLFGEIQQIILTWQAGLCSNTCIQALEKRLKEIPAVQELRFNPSAGMATMHWSAGATFWFEPFNTATRMVGIRLSTIRLKVSGKVVKEGSFFYLNSTGDTSRFRLIGPLQASAENYTIQQNVTNYSLSPQMVAQLNEWADKKTTISVSGPLFEPNRPALILIVEDMHPEKKPTKSETSSSSKRFLFI